MRLYIIHISWYIWQSHNRPKALHAVVALNSSVSTTLAGIIQGMMAKQVKARRRLLTWHMSVLPWRFCRLGRHMYTNRVISRKVQLVISRKLFIWYLSSQIKKYVFYISYIISPWTRVICLFDAYGCASLLSIWQTLMNASL